MRGNSSCCRYRLHPFSGDAVLAPTPHSHAVHLQSVRQRVDGDALGLEVFAERFHALMLRN